MDRDALVARCKARFNDPQNRTYSDDEWVEYIGDAVADVYAHRSDWPFAQIRSETSTLTAGDETITISTPAAPLRVTSLYNETDQIPMQPIHGDAHREMYLDNTSLGAPQFYRVFQQFIYVYPAPARDTTFSVEAYRALPELGVGASTPDFEDRFHRILVFGALRYAYEDDGNDAMADRYQARFDRLLADMVQAYFSPAEGGYPPIIDTF